jgi:4-amino-4-deoxy-L-arabinose transferase-like glycosyltransferase
VSETVAERVEDRAAPDGAPWFARSLAAIALLGLAVRVAYVLIARDGVQFSGDSYFYHRGATLLAEGHGFIEPFFYPKHIVQAAEHPPLYLVYLAVPSLFGWTSTLTHLLWSCVLGTATIVVVGALGRAALNARVGCIAALLAALYPNLWIPDGSLEAETAAIFTTALTLLLAYRYLQRPSMWRLAAVGAAAGAATMARSELVLLVPFIAVPLALSTRSLSVRDQLRWLAAAVIGALLFIGPWVGYNISRFEHPVWLSAQYPALLASANCDATYHGRLLGYFSIDCASRYARESHARGDQSQQAIGFQRPAVRYIKHHLGRLPVVVAARIGRIAEVFRPGQNLSLREYLDNIEKPVAGAALATFYLLAVLSVVGGVMLRRRRRRLWLLMSVPVVVLVTTAVTYGNTRFRASAEVVLAVLAAVAIDALLARGGVRIGAPDEALTGAQPA